MTQESPWHCRKPNQRKGQNEKFMNFAHFCEFWCFSLGKQARFTLNFCSGMPLRKVHELTFFWFGLPGPLLNDNLRLHLRWGALFRRTSETPTTTTSQKSIAIHLQFVSQYASNLYRSTFGAPTLWGKGNTASTPPICIAVRPLFVLQYASHLYHSTFGKIVVVVVAGMFPIYSEEENLPPKIRPKYKSSSEQACSEQFLFTGKKAKVCVNFSRNSLRFFFLVRDLLGRHVWRTKLPPKNF